MQKRIKIILILLTLSVTLSFMSHTYSRYVADATSNVELSFAKWQILVNTEDITTGTTNNIEITPVIEENNNIKANTIAPSSKGYFDILVNPTNVEMSFDYKVTIDILNENMPDILISKYAILSDTYVEGNEVTKQDITDNEITGTLVFNNKENNFEFKPFTIRVYFEWFEGTNELMDDEKDTSIGLDAANNNTKLQIAAAITFTQNLNAQLEEQTPVVDEIIEEENQEESQ